MPDLAALLDGLRRQHEVACLAAPWNEHQRRHHPEFGTACDCGADAHNARVEELRARVAALADEPAKWSALADEIEPRHREINAPPWVTVAMRWREQVADADRLAGALREAHRNDWHIDPGHWTGGKPCAWCEALAAHDRKGE